MKKVFSSLPDDIYISEINIPGTHDSCTAFCTMENMSRCQELTVRQQLERGIRLFDIRLNKSGNEFYLVHSLADCFSDSGKQNKLTFSEVQNDFCEFLKANPEETVVVSVKQDRGIMNRWFFPSFYDKYIKGNEGEWCLANENPTLSECRGKMVLMRRCRIWPSFRKKHPAGLDFSYWKDQKGKRKKGHEKVVLSPGIKDPVLTAFVQDRYSLEPCVKWNESAKPFLEKSVTNRASIYVHFLSTAYREKGETLFETAERVNAEFMKYELKGDCAQGWMLFDFPSEELVDKVIKSNFEIYKEKTK